MPLTSVDAPASRGLRRSLPRVVATTGGGVVAFVLALAVAAWWTRDTPRGVPAEPMVAAAMRDDAGEVLSPDIEDAGSVVLADAGPPVTVVPGTDAGPAEPARPPVDVAAASDAIAQAAQACLEEAVRFDPSLGGTGTLRLALAGGEHGAGHAAAASDGVSFEGVPSPFFSRCFLARVRSITAGLISADVGVAIELRMDVTLDGLRTRASVSRAELVDVSAR